MDRGDYKLLERQCEIVSHFKNCFESVAGEKVIAYLQYRFFCKRTTLEAEAVDPNRLIFNEGSRAAVLHIIDMVNFDLEAAHKAIDDYSAEQGIEDELAT